MNKKIILFFLLLFFLLGNAVAPFILNDYHGNIVPVSFFNLEILNENITFNIFDNKIEGEAIYEILNNENETNVGFIFPLYSKNREDFEISFNGNKVDYIIIDELKLKETLSDKWGNFEKVVSKENIIFIDPIKKSVYFPHKSYFYNGELKPKFYKFIIPFEENSKNFLNIKFKAFASEDRKSYPKNLYSYFYILNTKDYFKNFKNIKIKIYYPKNYIFSVNLDGETKIIDDKILYEINLKDIVNNLTFSYMKNKISNLSLFLYKNFPIFFSPYFIFIILFILYLSINFYFIIYIFKKLKRKRRNV
jgi:hypothetical protein